MQKLGDKLKDAGVATPARTTFADGRMATKEAWLYCCERCRAKELDPPTIMMFRWHLKYGQYLESEMVPNPFGKYPPKIYAIEKAAVRKFVEELEIRGDTLAVIATRQKGGIVRRRAGRTDSATPSTKNAPQAMPDTPEVQPSTPTPAEAIPPLFTPKQGESVRDDGEVPAMTRRQAYDYLCKQAGDACDLSWSNFRMYAAYDVIDSHLEGRQRFFSKEDIDVFLELYPTGDITNHLRYKTAPGGVLVDKGDLTVQEAFNLYLTLDSDALSRGTFSSLITGGIISSIRLSNSPKAKLIGVEATAVHAFVKRRGHLEKKYASLPARKGFAARRAGSPAPAPKVTTKPKAKPKKARKAAPKAAKVFGEETPVSESGRPYVLVKAGYDYYCERHDAPLGESWFRSKCYQGKYFRVVRFDGKAHTNNPTGKVYLVDLDSVDEYLAGAGLRQKAKPQKACPVDKAFYKFKDLIPPGLSLIRFQRLVHNGEIPSFVRDSVLYVQQDELAAHFGQEVEPVQTRARIDKKTLLPVSEAYKYYCVQAPDPVAQAHFWRFVSEGVIGSGRKTHGVWMTSRAAVDAFLAKWPSGRKRINKNSRVRQNTKASGSARKPQPSFDIRDPAPVEAPDPTPTPAQSAKPKIVVRISDYPTTEELSSALSVLQAQGFEVQVKP